MGGLAVWPGGQGAPGWGGSGLALFTRKQREESCQTGLPAVGAPRPQPGLLPAPSPSLPASLSSLSFSPSLCFCL